MNLNIDCFRFLSCFVTFKNCFMAVLYFQSFLRCLKCICYIFQSTSEITRSRKSGLRLGAIAVDRPRALPSQIGRCTGTNSTTSLYKYFK
jgi:hypothetical protein